VPPATFTEQWTASYQDVFAFEVSLGVCFDYVPLVGDFGIWPDPNRIDKATRHHDGVGDFPAWLREGRGAPRPTSSGHDGKWLACASLRSPI
jgi:hypothetical protein